MLKMALILAARKGQRILPAETKPKPLISVAGTPLLFKVLNGLKLVGIGEAYIVVGYMATRSERS